VPGVGEVQTGEAVQTVPLYEDTALTLWDDCSCEPTFTPPGTAQAACSLPNAQQPDPFIGYEMTVPKGSTGSAITICRMALTFFLEEDTTNLMPNRGGTLVCDFSHTAAIGDSFNYVITIAVRLNGEVATIEEREFNFAQLPPFLGSDEPIGTPYSAGNKQVRFAHMFEAGRTYQAEIEVSGTLLGDVGDPTCGGQITFGLDVDDLRIEF
jgi:hypothetical protein